eukprot:TRINITY_DN4421_c0_g3_i1.p1 TRINITY_DN4421_c0_g3~~TRINITY_DN4421_c0_g3_i1.p1  ORF type:complete len:1619 (-),score=379.98 TRINITY_DN4421_c0_g3_i1:550-4863(-)
MDLLRDATIPAPWWTHDSDFAILSGVYRHGYGNYELVRDDPQFRTAFGPFAKAQSGGGLRKEEGGGRVEEGGALKGAGAEETEAGTEDGAPVWPDAYTLTRRLKRLLDHLHKLGRKGSRSARSGKPVEAGRAVIVPTKVGMARPPRRVNQWLKREKLEFVRVLFMWGFLAGPSGTVAWRSLSERSNMPEVRWKSEEALEACAAALLVEARRLTSSATPAQRERAGKAKAAPHPTYCVCLVCRQKRKALGMGERGKGGASGGLSVDGGGGQGKAGAGVETGPPVLVLSSAIRLVERLELLEVLRWAVATCRNEWRNLEITLYNSHELPDWWLPGPHDRAMAKGILKHGFGNWAEIVSDSTLAFHPFLTSAPPTTSAPDLPADKAPLASLQVSPQPVGPSDSSAPPALPLAPEALGASQPPPSPSTSAAASSEGKSLLLPVSPPLPPLSSEPNFPTTREEDILEASSPAHSTLPVPMTDNAPQPPLSPASQDQAGVSPLEETVPPLSEADADPMGYGANASDWGEEEEGGAEEGGAALAERTEAAGGGPGAGSEARGQSRSVALKVESEAEGGKVEGGALPAKSILRRLKYLEKVLRRQMTKTRKGGKRSHLDDANMNSPPPAPKQQLPGGSSQEAKETGVEENAMKSPLEPGQGTEINPPTVAAPGSSLGSRPFSQGFAQQQTGDLVVESTASKTASELTREKRRAKEKSFPPLDEGHMPKKYKYGKAIDVKRDTNGQPVLPLALTERLHVTCLGTVVTDRAGWHSERHIFPAGYTSVREHASFLHPNERTTYTSTIVDSGTGPMFRVTPHDAPEQAVERDSASGAWVAVSTAVNKLRGIERDKVAINGTEMYGLSHPVICRLIQELPNADKCIHFRPELSFARFEKVAQPSSQPQQQQPLQTAPAPPSFPPPPVTSPIPAPFPLPAPSPVPAKTGPTAAAANQVLASTSPFKGSLSALASTPPSALVLRNSTSAQVASAASLPSLPSSAQGSVSAEVASRAGTDVAAEDGVAPPPSLPSPVQRWLGPLPQVHPALLRAKQLPGSRPLPGIPAPSGSGSQTPGPSARPLVQSTAAKLAAAASKVPEKVANVLPGQVPVSFLPSLQSRPNMSLVVTAPAGTLAVPGSQGTGNNLAAIQQAALANFAHHNRSGPPQLGQGGGVNERRAGPFGVGPAPRNEPAGTGGSWGVPGSGAKTMGMAPIQSAAGASPLAASQFLYFKSAGAGAPSAAGATTLQQQQQPQLQSLQPLPSSPSLSNYGHTPSSSIPPNLRPHHLRTGASPNLTPPVTPLALAGSTGLGRPLGAPSGYLSAEQSPREGGQQQEPGPQRLIFTPTNPGGGRVTTSGSEGRGSALRGDAARQSGPGEDGPRTRGDGTGTASWLGGPVEALKVDDSQRGIVTPAGATARLIDLDMNTKPNAGGEAEGELATGLMCSENAEDV